MPATGSIDGETAAARLRRIPKPTRRTRKQYRLTERGYELFAEQLRAEDAPGADDEKAFALKVAFCRHLPSDARIQLLERRRAGLNERLAQARGDHPAAAATDTSAPLAEHRTESTAPRPRLGRRAHRRRAAVQIIPDHHRKGATAS